ncbi:hypothetical protein CBR_g41428 [Chara braunii]|uniref:Retrotransposon gag domain-containing protein n=1 Tax=Chara braunii TaxID=69332 RepID=A0A388LVZ3_CHABU|nr:hypothetical protein CBR_g41428 [Chara braunii]|eukprot:GBG86431.1 hypothetical protein CBR_g41428 [Chara braunii]
MPDSDGIERGPGATPEDFVKALEKREMARLQVPKVNIFHFNGDRVSEWLELLEQVTCEASEADKFKLMPRYVWWELRPEVMKVAADANGEWARFKEEMQRRFKLGDGLLTKEDMEMLRRDEFSTVGAFATAFEKMAKKVPGMAEEEQCATFLGHFKNWEASSLTKKVAPGKKLTWGAIKKGVLEGELDQVDIFQMRQARKKRKTLDTIASDGRNFKLMIEEAVAQHDAEKDARKKAMAAPQAQGKGKKVAVLEEEEEEEEPEPQKLTKAQRKARLRKRSSPAGCGDATPRVVRSSRTSALWIMARLWTSQSLAWALFICTMAKGRAAWIMRRSADEYCFLWMAGTPVSTEEERMRMEGGESEGDDPSEALTLSLANIRDAMDIVSIYGMADLVAVEALREKVMERRGEGS